METDDLEAKAWRDLEIAAAAKGRLEVARLTLPIEKVRALIEGRRRLRARVEWLERGKAVWQGIADHQREKWGEALDQRDEAESRLAAQAVEALRECLKRLEAEHGGYDPQDIRCSTCRTISQGHVALSALTAAKAGEGGR